MLPESPDAYRLTVMTDCYQFCLEDPQAHDQWMRSHANDPDLPPAGWTSEAVYVHRIGVQPHSLAIGTAWDDRVEVALRFHPAEPPTWAKEAEHVVEADVDVPNGDLVICCPTAVPPEEHHVSIEPGRYRVRVSYIPSEPPDPQADETGHGKYFVFQADLWPASNPEPLVVLKQGTSL